MRGANSQSPSDVRRRLQHGSPNTGVTGSPSGSPATVHLFAVVWFCLIALALPANAQSSNPTPPTIVSGALAGSVYAQTLAATGTAPITWSVSSGTLPAGLSLGSTTGIISGTPMAPGVFTFTISATNAGGSNSKQFSLTVNAPPPPSIVTTSPLPDALALAVYSQTLKASGVTPITWAVTNGALSAGLTLDSASGTLRGTPTVLGVANLTVSATNAFGSSFANFSLTVKGRPCDSEVTFSGPIVISAGGTYTGNWQSTSLATPAVNITTTAPVTITNSRIRAPGDGITAMWNNQVTITNNCFVGANPNVLNVAKGSPVRIQNPTSATVEHNDFESTGGNGVSVQQYWGNFTTANTIKIRYNRFHNIDGRYSDGAGGYLTSVNGFASHAVIFSLAQHIPGVEVAWNQVINEAGQSQVTDSINMFSSSGTATSPLLIHDNYIQGQYSANPAKPEGLGYAGTGIVTDDPPGITDPVKATSFVKIYNNQVVSIALAGISISAGHDNEVYSNRVISSGRVADGTVISSSSAAGVGTNNYLKEPPGIYGNNSIHDNFSGVLRYRDGKWERSDYYFGVAPTFALNNTQFTPTTAVAPSLTAESNEFWLWSQKLSANGITLGSSLVVHP